jgi:hypothetical protein
VPRSGRSCCTRLHSAARGCDCSHSAALGRCWQSVIIALCNKDPLRGKDTFIGAAIVPLCPDGAEPGTPPPEEYAVNFEQELTHGNARGEIGACASTQPSSHMLTSAWPSAIADGSRP